MAYGVVWGEVYRIHPSQRKRERSFQDRQNPFGEPFLLDPPPNSLCIIFGLDMCTNINPEVACVG